MLFMDSKSLYNSLSILFLSLSEAKNTILSFRLNLKLSLIEFVDEN